MTHSWKPEFTSNDVVILEDKIVFSGYCQVKEFQMRHRLFAGGWSSPITRQVFTRPLAIAVLLYDPDADKVVLIEQFRVGALEEADSPWILEIVAGLVDADESVEQAVYREVEEEAGCELLSLIPVCAYLMSPGTTAEKMLIYCGRVKAPSQGKVCGLVEEVEDIKVHVIPTSDAFELLFQGKITSSPAIIALQWLKINHASLRFPQ